jgi:hypothetical protein
MTRLGLPCGDDLGSRRAIRSEPRFNSGSWFMDLPAMDSLGSCRCRFRPATALITWSFRLTAIYPSYVPKTHHQTKTHHQKPDIRPQIS